MQRLFSTAPSTVKIEDKISAEILKTPKNEKNDIFLKMKRNIYL
jgi:hypothetical protein